MIELTKTVLNHPITVTAQKLGNNWSVTIFGGCTPHVGSVSLAEYQNGTAILRTLMRTEHKDQIVGDLFAQTIASQCHCTVCVTCGIHYDGPTKKELVQIVTCTYELLTQLCTKL